MTGSEVHCNLLGWLRGLSSAEARSCGMCCFRMVHKLETWLLWNGAAALSNCTELFIAWVIGCGTFLIRQVYLR